VHSSDEIPQEGHNKDIIETSEVPTQAAVMEPWNIISSF
jgi:hypothetical protein